MAIRWQRQIMMTTKKVITATITDSEIVIEGQGSTWRMPLSRVLPANVSRWTTNEGIFFHPDWYGVNINVHGGTYAGYMTRCKSAAEAQEFADAINAARDTHRRSTAPSAADRPSAADALKELQLLRDQGLISEAEFQTKRTDILGRL